MKTLTSLDRPTAYRRLIAAEAELQRAEAEVSLAESLDEAATYLETADLAERPPRELWVGTWQSVLNGQRPTLLLRSTPRDAVDSGWLAVTAAIGRSNDMPPIAVPSGQTASETAGPPLVELHLAHLIEQYPEIGPVVADPFAAKAWTWDEATSQYVALPSAPTIKES